MAPATPARPTPSAVAGCPLPAGDLAASVERARENQLDWVSAAPFRAHLRHLVESQQLPWRALALLAEVPPAVVERLLRGRDGVPVRRIRMSTARRLYALDGATVLDARQTMVPADRAVRALAQFVARGWPPTELAARLRVSSSVIEQLLASSAPAVRGSASASPSGPEPPLVCSRLVDVLIRAGAGAVLGDPESWAA